MKVIDYKEQLIDKAIEELTKQAFTESKTMISSNPYNNSVLYSILCESFYLGKSSNNFDDFKKRLKKIINLQKAIKQIKLESD